MTVLKGDRFKKGGKTFTVDSKTVLQSDGTPVSAVLIDKNGVPHLVLVTELESDNSGWTKI